MQQSQQFILIDKNELENFKESILDGVKELLSNAQFHQKPLQKPLMAIDKIDNWIPLKAAWKKLGISKSSWYDGYDTQITWKKEKGRRQVWVSVESILKFLEK